MGDLVTPRETVGTRQARRRWTHAGLDCAMIDSRIGFVNGYVRLPEDHVGHDATYDQLNRAVSVHGGLTYAGDDGWFGFDTGHGGDYWPGMTDERRMFAPAERTWDLERLAAEVESLAEQLAALTEIPGPESQWDCTESEFQALLRDARAWREHNCEVTP